MYISHCILKRYLPGISLLNGRKFIDKAIDLISSTPFFFLRTRKAASSRGSQYSDELYKPILLIQYHRTLTTVSRKSY